jgi:hypothetical protein
MEFSESIVMLSCIEGILAVPSDAVRCGMNENDCSWAGKDNTENPGIAG